MVGRARGKLPKRSAIRKKNSSCGSEEYKPESNCVPDGKSGAEELDDRSDEDCHENASDNLTFSPAAQREGRQGEGPEVGGSIQGAAEHGQEVVMFLHASVEDQCGAGEGKKRAEKDCCRP